MSVLIHLNQWDFNLVRLNLDFNFHLSEVTSLRIQIKAC